MVRSLTATVVKQGCATTYVAHTIMHKGKTSYPARYRLNDCRGASNTRPSLKEFVVRALPDQ